MTKYEHNKTTHNMKASVVIVFVVFCVVLVCDRAQGAACSTHNGNLSACDAEPGCAYYICGSACRPRVRILFVLLVLENVSVVVVLLFVDGYCWLLLLIVTYCCLLLVIFAYCYLLALLVIGGDCCCILLLFWLLLAVCFT